MISLIIWPQQRKLISVISHQKNHVYSISFLSINWHDGIMKFQRSLTFYTKINDKHFLLEFSIKSCPIAWSLGTHRWYQNISCWVVLLDHLIQHEKGRRITNYLDAIQLTGIAKIMLLGWREVRCRGPGLHIEPFTEWNPVSDKICGF